MGATLSGTWASGIEEDTEEIGSIQYSKYPFSTGLAHIGRTNELENIEGIPEAG